MPKSSLDKCFAKNQREISWINEFPPNENKYQKKFLACFIFLVFEIFKSLFTPYN